MSTPLYLFLRILPGANEEIKIYEGMKCKGANHNIYELLPIYFSDGVETEIIFQICIFQLCAAAVSLR